MTVRITLALLFVIPAALAYPWHTVTDRWILGVAIAVVVVLFAWWRGLFVTDMVRRRVAIWRRNRAGGGHSRRPEQPDTYVTSVLRVEPGGTECSADLPLPLIAGYVDRYGVRADKVRVVSRDRDGARTTWIAVTVGATENLAALQARSPQLPLRETADVAARRLADHLREIGWHITPVGDTDTPVAAAAKETWRGLRTGSGHVAAYRVAVDDRLPDTLAAVTAHDSAETWTAIDISGTATHPKLTAACALRTEQRPPAGAPVPGLTPARGAHGPALKALTPASVARLDGTPVRTELLQRLTWPVDRRPAGELAEAGPSYPQ
ncbi:MULTISPECIES: type VII secretion protein EccE [Mycobacteriaceae]|uniref:type VII secretion protein EccE n=1 Tax=Mycobacteriaceae TaxID=1762 RepID=UPI0007FF8F91|nr:MULTISPECIES: type VII secretion protein EccE [Mycobacteriaceae]MCK0177281.1 type VII secretion protein EccE [Mycolicibacterium sp. F2034L]OBB62215.1 type VII secretion protein EccE [Mycobacterium sp. 852013-51886_SCH5428379]